MILALIAHTTLLADDWTTVRDLYYQAVEGNRASGERAATMLDAMRSSNPDAPLLLVYRGSLTLLQSSWTMAPWRKGKLAKEGLQMMDRAVTAAPRDLEIRFVRAASTMRLPGFFHRSEQSTADFAEIAPLVVGAARSAKLEPRLASAALHYHALNREKAGDRQGASQACRQTIEIGSDTPGAIACRSRYPAK